MAPTADDDVAQLERPILLNEKFKVYAYDGGEFKSRTQYDIKNALIPIIEPFHCSSKGTKFCLVLKCSEDFTMTHFYVSGPGPRCTEPIKSGLVWVTDQPPDAEKLKKYNTMSSEEMLEIVKGLRTYSSSEEAGNVPDPCVYFTTDPSSRESEVELPKWREGKYLTVKFLDTHKDQENIDVGIVGIIGYLGRKAKQQLPPLGPWMRRCARQAWVHPNVLKSMFSSSGWVCDGRDFTGGCRSGQTDFHQTSVYTVTFRCTSSGFDLCEKCAYDSTMGRVTDESIQSDLEALADNSSCKLAVTRLRNLFRRNWMEALPRYFQAGLLDTLVQSLQKVIENSQRPEEERATAQRQQPGAENHKRQLRRALLGLLAELTQRVLGGGVVGGAGDAPNELVWAYRAESEQHWDEGRIVQSPKDLGDTLYSRPLDPPVLSPQSSSSAVADADGTGGNAAAEESAAEAATTAVVPQSSDTPAAVTGAEDSGATAASSNVESTAKSRQGYLISWRDGSTSSWVPPQHVLRTSADEEIMKTTALLFFELARGSACDRANVSALLGKGADLMAVNGEGCTPLLLAVRAGVPVDILKVLLEAGACPDASGREGVTPAELILRFKSEGREAAEELDSALEVLKSHGATLFATKEQHKECIKQLRETFGLKMVGSLLTLQSPLSLPVEILEVLLLLIRELPTEVFVASLEAQAFRALTALLQHFVGGADSLASALIGCRIMRALCRKSDPKLRYIVRSHGALRWAERLSSTKDLAMCGLHKQINNEKVTVEELSKEAQGLHKDLVAIVEGESHDQDCEWKVNAKLVEVVESFEKLDDPSQGFLTLRELLKRTEQGSISDDRCSAFELEKANIPRQLLRYLKQQATELSGHLKRPLVHPERWFCFLESFGDTDKHSRKGLGRLMKALHAVIETAEVLPVWRHKRERGLKSLVETHPLKLRYLQGSSEDNLEPSLPKAAKSVLPVFVEPLVPLSEISNFLLKVTPCTDPAYLTYCHRLVGATINDAISGTQMQVDSFEILAADLPLPVHTIIPVDGGDAKRVLLAARSYSIVGMLVPASAIANLALNVAMNRLQATTSSENYPRLLEKLEKILSGDADALTGSEEPAFQQVLATATASSSIEEALSIIGEEKSRFAVAVGLGLDTDGSSEAHVDPSMRVHQVMIAVSDEIPFDLFWPMVRDDIISAVREICPRGMPGMEATVQAGVAQNGMGPVASKLTLVEAENLAARLGHVVQTAVTVDHEAAQEAQRDRSKSAQAEPIQVSSRVQFTPRASQTWVPGTVVGQFGERYSIVDDQGVLWEHLPKARLRVPPGRRDSLASQVGGPIQAILSQGDLLRIREHLRRRQQEWAERNSQHWAGSGAAAASGHRAVHGSGEEASTSQTGDSRTPTASSRPISAPAVVAQPQRSSSAQSGDGTARRGIGAFFSREGSMSEADAGAMGGLDVHFMDDEGMGDDDYDDEDGGTPGDEGEDDDDDIPGLEGGEDGPMEALSLGRRGDEDGGAAMDDEMRVLEQLRAMEQIISEVLDPQDGSRSGRIGLGDTSDDVLSAPMTNLGIRMGGGDARIETYAVRRASASKSSSTGVQMEPLRGMFPSFVRATDVSSSTSTLDHPVVERLGAADLVPIEEDSGEHQRGRSPPKIHVRFCLLPKDNEPTASSTTESEQAPPPTTTATPSPASPPVILPKSWNLLKAMQYLQDQQVPASQKDTAVAASKDTTPILQPLQKVPLEHWHLGYQIEFEPFSEDDETREQGTDPPSKKRRRFAALPNGQTYDAVAREMYSDHHEAGSSSRSVSELIGNCSENAVVADAIELLQILHSRGESLGTDFQFWISSKLDRKLRYQLEDPLTVISGTLPVWAMTLPRLCPFLFSLKTRKMLLKYTAFGPSFAVHWTQEHKVGSLLKRRATVQTELNAQTDPRKMQELSQELSNIEEHVVRSIFWLGTIQSTLVRLQKGDDLLRQSDVAMELLSSAGKLMEVQFDGETGFGIAVTQSFYVEVAQALQEKSHNKACPMWVQDDESSGDDEHLLCRKGLLIKPLPPGPLREQVCRRFKFLGRLMAQGLREGFIVPLPVAEEFFALLLGEELGPSRLPRPGHGCAGEFVGALADFVAELNSGEAAAIAQGLDSATWRNGQATRSDFTERFLTPSGGHDMSMQQEPMSFNEYTSMVGVSFLETGLSGAPLCADGESMAVTIDNVKEFVEKAADFWYNTGVSEQVKAFRAGLNEVFPFECLYAFSCSELREMFCGEDRIDWDEQQLLNHLHPTGGLTEKSSTYKFLVAVLLELNQAERSRFLDFVTSCPRLPPGGISKFHVDVFPDTGASRQAFPRSRACANQLYLPPYTSKTELQEKLLEAMFSSAGHHEQRVRDQ